MARLAGLALEPLEGTCGAGGITVKRPCYLFPSVIGKAHNREEGGFIFFMPGFLEFPLHDNVSHIAITYGYFSRPVIVVSYIMYHPKVIFVIVGVTAIALPHCCFGLWYLFLCIRYDIRAQWQTPGGANPRRGAHIHTFQSRMVRGDGCSPPPFMWGPSIHRGKPVAELRLSSRGGLSRSRV